MGWGDRVGGTPSPFAPVAGSGGGFGSRVQPQEKTKGGGGLLHDVARYSGAELVGNLGSDVGHAAVGVFPGLYNVGKAGVLDVGDAAQGKHPTHLKHIGGQIVQGYKDYYGHDLLHHLYQHPLQPLLDVATVASGGLGAAGKVADVVAPESRVATALTGRGQVVTRSPRKIATGKGPARTDITSTRPLTKARELAGTGLRNTTESVVVKVPGQGHRVGVSESKRYGAQIRQEAGRAALGRIEPVRGYAKAVRRLSPAEWTALHIRALDVHPTALKQLWRDTPNGKALADPKVAPLVLHPSPRMLRAEPALKALSDEGAALYRGGDLLSAESEAARPELTRRQASEMLGREVDGVPSGPGAYYFPHAVEPTPIKSPLASRGGGKAPPKTPGTAKFNTGALSLGGNLHLRSDILGPEFLRRVTHVKYTEIHNGLRRGAVRMTREQLQEHGGKPAGFEYLRASAGQRIPFDLRGEGAPAALRDLIPDPNNLRTSPLGEGFTTANPEEALQANGRYYLVPKATARAATGEFHRSSAPVYYAIHKPLQFWRAVVLGLRVGFLTNNLVGNSIMYSARTGGRGALRDLFGALMEMHGRETGLKLLHNSATPPELRADLINEFFPEQTRGTFGLTQSPSAGAGVALGKVSGAAKAATGAIPKLTSKVAEETPRRALVRNMIRNSPEFKRVYRQLPRQTRTFEQAARQVLEGRGGKAYQRYISKQVNQALGDYLGLSSFERSVLRNALPFYAWYRAITTTTFHLAADTPLRANILGQIGQIGRQQGDEALRKLGDIAEGVAPVPSFLEGAIGVGHGKGGTVKALATQGLNPYSTLAQLGVGGTSDLTSLGLNPFFVGLLERYARAADTQHTAFPHVSPLGLLGGSVADIVRDLPPSRLIAPKPPSRLYPNRGRKSEGLSFVGLPVKDYNPGEAARQAKAGR